VFSRCCIVSNTSGKIDTRCQKGKIKLGKYSAKPGIVVAKRKPYSILICDSRLQVDV